MKFPSCLNPGADAEIIRCSSCMIKVHASCVDETATYGAWRCTKCRKMCENLQILLHDMSYTCKEIHDLKLNYLEANTRITALESKLEAANKEIISLKQSNLELLQQTDNNNTLLGTLVSQNDILKNIIKNGGCNSVNQTSVINVTPPDLLIGDSILRDFHSTDQKKLMIRSFSGAKLNDIKSKLDLFAHDKKKFSTISIVAGTNDCSLSHKSTEQIMEDTTQVLETATKIADKVVLSSILPRTDNSTAHLKGENINPQFRNLCIRMPKVRFIDNDKNFRLADASPNDAYVDLSGLQLSKQGTERLIKNLEVKAVFRKRSPRQPSQPANFHSNISQNYMWGKTSSTASVPFNQNYYMGNSANAWQSPIAHPGGNTQQYVLSHQKPVTSYQPMQQHTFVQNMTNNQSLHQRNDAQPQPLPASFTQPPICHRCGRNHIASICPLDSSIRCFTCGSPGHTSQACNYQNRSWS